MSKFNIMLEIEKGEDLYESNDIDTNFYEDVEEVFYLKFDEFNLSEKYLDSIFKKIQNDLLTSKKAKVNLQPEWGTSIFFMVTES